jgi:hypothetical protein
MTTTKIQFLWQNRSVPSNCRTGVSLHSHTMYSEEKLEVIPRYADRIPFLREAVRREENRYRRRKQEPLDFSRAFWSPPLPPREAYRVEQQQIEQKLGLVPLVSITDHDDVRAAQHLRVMEEYAHVPVSTEWTIPFGPTFFHIGAHNLPAPLAPAISAELASYTANPEKRRLYELLDCLHGIDSVLLVLNHPLWDEGEIGVSDHAHVLGRLLERHGHHLHALEVNGLRSWKENRQVIRLGRESGHPIVAGGDRHGLEPNAILNLTSARTIEDFVAEVRMGCSHVVFMPHYHEPLRWRVLQTMLDIVRDYPDNPKGLRSWSDRVFYRLTPGAEPIPLSQYWPNNEPVVIRAFVKAVRVAEFRGIRSALRFALNDRAGWSDRGEALV